VRPARQRAERRSGERGRPAGEKWAGERSAGPHGGKGRGEKTEAAARPRRGRKGRWAGPAGLGREEKKKGTKEKEEWAGPTRKKREKREMLFKCI
jgi:hypothetical protein